MYRISCIFNSVYAHMCELSVFVFCVCRFTCIWKLSWIHLYLSVEMNRQPWLLLLRKYLQFYSLLSKDYFLLMCVCVCLHNRMHMNVGINVEVRERHWVPWSWSYMLLLPAKWRLLDWIQVLYSSIKCNMNIYKAALWTSQLSLSP